MNASIVARFRQPYVDFSLDVDLVLPGKGITVLFGHSGSGKTTLLRCIAGLQKAPRGLLSVNGNIWQDSERNIFVPTYQRSLGYVFQEANLFPHLNVTENLHFGLKRLGKSASGNALQNTIALLGIEHLLTRMPEHLSGGEKQRVAIARSLALNPSLLLMDEPLAALDYPRKQELLPYFMRLHQELSIPVLYVTHSQQEMAQLADHLVIMANGQAIAQGALSETLTRLDLPLAHQQQAATVWEGHIAEHNNDDHLTTIAFEGTRLSVSAVTAAIGTPIRVQILARDVSITLEHPSATSILNILPAHITGLADDHVGQTLVQLAVGQQIMLAHISRKSARLLNLQLDMPVYLQIKGTSILN